ncbi:hypothetical protein RXV95_06680 [Novosphingobium sp. ZN18A2]|uniref:hypothetical protein n=1 Tax=Novosphingobium sp. ZN18A2 TaxID=3079861 RepID=UPI0030CD282D
MKTIAALAAVSLGLAVSAQALAQSVIVRSTGPSASSYPPGKRLPAGTKITLRSGDVVTVLDKVGTRVLRGAGSFDLDATSTRNIGGAARLARSMNSPVAVRAGAVRGGVPNEAGPILPPSIWIADIDKGGRVCVPRGSDLYLWRGEASQRRYTWLGEAEGGAMTRILWPKNTAGVPWPRAVVSLSDGQAYRSVDDSASDNGVDFELVVLDPDKVPTDASGLGVMLLDNGCKAQFEWLAKTLEEPAAESATAP